MLGGQLFQVPNGGAAILARDEAQRELLLQLDIIRIDLLDGRIVAEGLIQKSLLDAQGAQLEQEGGIAGVLAERLLKDARGGLTAASGIGRFLGFHGLTNVDAPE